jgi:antitoxin YefM
MNEFTNDYENIIPLVLNGKPYIISTPEKKNLVLISEEEFEDLQRIKKNMEYYAKLDKAQEDIKNGNTISFTMEELKSMENMSDEEFDKHMSLK